MSIGQLDQPVATVPCRSCCAFDVAVPNDLDGGFAIFATQALSFVITVCPIGVICPPGLLPQTVNVGVPPPVIVPPGCAANGCTLTLQGCRSLIAAQVPFSATQALMQQIGFGMQQQWGQQQAACNLVTQNHLKTFHSTVTVFNTIQIAQCVPPNFGDPVTTPAGTVGTTLFDPTTADVQSAQTAMNNLALAQARAQQFCFKPGPDWRQLVWDTYNVIQTPPNSTVLSPTPTGYKATGTLFKDAGAFPATISPVHASMLYTGPGGNCRGMLAISGQSGFTQMSLAVYQNGVQIAVFVGGFVVNGTTTTDFAIAPGMNSLIELFDVSPGNHFASTFGGGTPGGFSFVFTVFNL